jgi:hypothetical protein
MQVMSIPLTKKKARANRGSTESSSSEETDRSKPPKDVLALGVRLVQELNLDQSVDTLGRWMAHHVAELMERAENAKSEKDRRAAGREAASTILELWKRRPALPGNVYPLARYAALLHRLDEAINRTDPFAYSYPPSGDTSTTELAGSALAGCVRLLAMFLHDEAKAVPSPARRNLESFLNSSERQTLDVIRSWQTIRVRFVAPAADSTAAASEAEGEDPNRDALELIDEAMTVLGRLRQRLGPKPAQGT